MKKGVSVMKCVSCGKENAASAEFCVVCGTGLKSNNRQTQQTYYTNSEVKGYPTHSEWTAYAGMISGILSLVCMISNFAVPVFIVGGFFFVLVTGLGGIVLGAIGTKTNYKGMALAGLLCGIAGIVVEIVIVILAWSAFMALLSSF